MPFDQDLGYRVVDTLKQVAARHNVSPARAALSWVLGRPAVSSVIVAARKAEQLEDNIGAVDLRLSDEDVRLLDAASDPGVPYPKWMVLQLDTAEDPRSKALYPGRYVDGGPWKDLRGTRWSRLRALGCGTRRPLKTSGALPSLRPTKCRTFGRIDDLLSFQAYAAAGNSMPIISEYRDEHFAGVEALWQEAFPK